MIISLDFSNYQKMSKPSAAVTISKPVDLDVETAGDNLGSFSCAHTQAMGHPEPVVRQCVAMMGGKCTKNVTAVINGLNCMGSWNFIALMRGDKVVDFRVFDPYREIISRDTRKDNEHPGHTFWWNGIGGNRSAMEALGMDESDIEEVGDVDNAQTRQYMIEVLGCNSARQLDLIEEMCL